MRVIRLLILLTLVLALLTSAAQKKKAKKKAKLPEAVSVLRTSVVTDFKQPGLAYQCTQNVTTNGNFQTCSDGSKVVYTRPVVLNSAAKVKNWETRTLKKCLQDNANLQNPKMRCVGISRKVAKQGYMAHCPVGTTLNPAITAKTPRPPIQMAIGLLPDCFEPLPTPSPTTAAPTPRPTRPTGAPVPPCVVEGVHNANFASLEGHDPRLDQWVEVKPDRKLCEYVRVQPLAGPGSLTAIENFTCTHAACLRWCQYDANCRYSMYSAKLKRCYKSNALELTDDESNYKQYFDEEWLTFRKITTTSIMYFSGKCNWLVPNTCNKHDECKWNFGKRGYNDPIQGGGAGGWCGRKRCLVENPKKKNG